MQRLLFHGLLVAVLLHTDIAEYGLQGTQAWELWHVDLAWGLPRPGIKPVSPALAGRFLKTGPAENSYITLLKIVPCSLPSCLHRTKAARYEDGCYHETKQKTTSVDGDMKKLELLCIVDRNAKEYSHCGKLYGGFSNT